MVFLRGYMPKDSRKLTYSEKLKDQRWQKKRLALLDASGWKCQSPHCNNPDPKPTLHVHHRVYLRNLMPWEYEDWAYVVLCEDCHEFEQKKMDECHIALAKCESLRLLCSYINGLNDSNADYLGGALLSIATSLPPQLAERLSESIGPIGSLLNEALYYGLRLGEKGSHR